MAGGSSSKSPFSLGRNDDSLPSADINVTPLVDVMLVLLIIFMVTAPMLFNGVELSLPKTVKAQKVVLNSRMVVVSIDRQGLYSINKKKTTIEQIVQDTLLEMKSLNQQAIFLQAHEDLPYGQVAAILTLLKKGGIDRISLVTEVGKKS